MRRTVLVAAEPCRLSEGYGHNGAGDSTRSAAYDPQLTFRLWPKYVCCDQIALDQRLAG
jgi:hypothetical protein